MGGTKQGIPSWFAGVVLFLCLHGQVLAVQGGIRDSSSLIGKYLRGTGGSTSQRQGMEGRPAQKAKAESVSRILLKADSFVRAGNFTTAASFLQKSTVRYPLSTKLKLALALVYERMEHNHKAIEMYRAIIGIDADHVPALSSLAFLMVENNMSSSQTARLLKRALDLNPGCGRAYDALGWSAFKKKKNDEATRYFTKARDLSPYDPSPLYHLGLIALRQRKTAKALSLFQQVIELDESHDKAYISLGILYLQMGENKKAVIALNRALIIAGTDSLVASSIVSLVKKAYPAWQPSDAKRMKFSFTRPGLRRDFFEALDFVTKEPDTSDVAGLRDPSLDKSGDRKSPLKQTASEHLSLLPEPVSPKAAEKEEQPSLSMDEAIAASEGLVQQNLVARHMRLGRLYYEFGLMKEAASEFKTVINISPLSPEAREAKEIVVPLSDFEELPLNERIEGLLKVGDTLYKSSDKDGAVLQFQKVLLLQPGHSLAHKNLAYIYLRDGMEAEAFNHIEEALSSDPQFGEALVLKGYILAKRRNFSQAYSAFSKAVERLGSTSENGRYAADMKKKMSMFIELR